jgi:UDP-GlcNAc:undecaprenyl-phosphate GlcNAc-1-phosphate transferase
MQFWMFVYTVIISTALAFVVRRLALHLHINAKNDYRRNHRGAIALWGGLGIYLTLVASYMFQPDEMLKLILISTFPLLVVGMADDRFELKASGKFCIQFVSALIWLYLNPSVNLLQSAGLPQFLSLFLSTFWIVGLCNAFNLIDGTDGQCSLVGVFAFMTVALSFPTLLPVAVPLVGATLGFLLWNHPPAKIYLGESGSTLLGFSLAIVTLTVPPTSFIGSSLLGVLFLAAFPLVDTVLAIGRRIVKKRPIFSGDKDHIHHLLQKIGFNKLQVLMIVGFMILAGDLTAYTIFKTVDPITCVILTLNNAALMSFTLLGLYYTKKSSAQKISYFGRTLLEKHLQNINIEPLPKSGQKGYLIDLLPYYAELQNGGTPTIIGFVKRISEHFTATDKYNLYSAGSYSIAAVYKKGQNWSLDEKKEINEHLKEIFKHFDVLKSLSDTPEGLYYFDHKNINELMDMLIEKMDKERSVTPLRKVS